ncbi:hypothetical protein Tco_0037956 [Tanacetum coccineum]
MNIQNEINCLQEMLNLRNSNQDPPDDLYYSEGSDEEDMEIDSLTKEPSDTLLMGDEVICTTLARENDEFIKSSVDDLVPIPRESEVTSDSNSECDMTTSLPTTYVRKEDFDINSPLREQFEDIGSLDSPESTPVSNESTLLVTSPLTSKQLSLREVERFDPFLSLTQPGGKTRVMETSSFGFHHMPSPRPAAYSLEEVMYCYYHPHLTLGDGFDPEIKKIPSDESKVHIEVLSVLWGNRLPIPDGSLPLSSAQSPPRQQSSQPTTANINVTRSDGFQKVRGLEGCRSNHGQLRQSLAFIANDEWS